MAASNTPQDFGWVSRLLHWLIALLVVAMIPLGLWISEAEPSLATLWLFGLHKSVGVVVLILMVLRLVWHVASPPPKPIPGPKPLADRFAVWVHRLFYAVLILLPLSGIVGSSATGIDTVVFDRWTLPSVSPVSEAWEDTSFQIHDVLGSILIVLLALHFAGAIYRAAISQDGTLRRMVFGSVGSAPKAHDERLGT